jgi:cellulose synthase/poly-beta-1,6-N-acetylglucosamine synthase-like glycosyltransferase
MIFLQVIFWTGLALVFHTYLLFPLILKVFAGNRELPRELPPVGDLPKLSVLIAAFNEEKVIEEKIRSVCASDYPLSKMEILVASDASTDGTDEILTALEKELDILQFIPFNKRTGKPGIINSLAEKAGGEILVITDANVMLDPRTLSQVISAFSDPRTGLVDTCMVNTRLRKDGISHQERFYISREVGIKHNESVLWGSMMGPFGGCYAVRKSCYTPVPGHFLVDDFFINMSVLKQGFKCVSNREAFVYEDVSNDLAEEFRRKKRISAGNFQNLARFSPLLLRFRHGIAFCFLSHKVLRWIVPFIVMLTMGTSLSLGFLAPSEEVRLLYMVFGIIQLTFLVIPVIDHFLRKLKLHSLPLRFISHFVLMNLALLAGFLRYTGGIKTNVWQPTRRNQGDAE